MEGTAVTSERRGGLSASAVKYIAIIAMFFDHFAYLFLPYDSLLYGAIRFFGRITAATMCFFICEGYHHTHDLKKYFLRLGIFAFISHFAFTYACHGSVLVIGTESVIATLLLSLLAVHIVNTDKGQTPTGPFSRVAVCGQRVIGSGVRAIIPGTQQRVSSDIRACANQCLTNLDINLQAAGSNIRKAYSMVVYLHNMNDVPTVMNVLYSWGLSESKMQLQFEYVDALNEYHDIEIAANAYL